MKIAIVLPGGVDRSGEYRVIPAFLALIERLARRHDVHVFVLHQEPLAATWPLLGATVHNTGKGWTRLRTVAAIRREHARARFDVVQALFSGACSQIALMAAMPLGVRFTVHIAGGELVALDDIGYGGRRFIKSRMREALTLRMAWAITAASAPIVDALAALGLHGQRIPLGVDIHAWPARAPQARRPGPWRLIHVASLNAVKDQRTLLHAMAVLAGEGRAFTLDVVGVDTLGGAMQALAAQLGISDYVRFKGFHTQRELYPVLAEADLLVMSSRHEAGPLVLLEAAVLGIPTVGTAVGHLVEWAPHAALTAPVGHAALLASQIVRVMGNDDLRLALAHEAQRRALAENADTTAEAFEALYRLAAVA